MHDTMLKHHVRLLADCFKVFEQRIAAVSRQLESSAPTDILESDTALLTGSSVTQAKPVDCQVD